MLPEKRTHSYFTTARVIHADGTRDWLWVNPSCDWQFTTKEEAQRLADLANHNGEKNGLDIVQYPYFVVTVTRTSQIERVE